ncbi:MAG: hypothetical protein PHP05_06945 [Sideroxydans sp.]|nr:hypothetical protein [Sideroxydans sp.]
MSQSQVIFSTGLAVQPGLGGMLYAAGIHDLGVRALIEAVVEAAKKEAPAIVAGIGVSYASPEAEAARAATGRVEVASLTANKALLLGALAAAGVETAEVQYSGDGDSGGVEDVDFTPVSVDVNDKKAMLLNVAYGWTGDRFVRVSIDKQSLENALSVFVDGPLLDHFGHSGYENNEGGGGTAIFVVKAGTITLNHYDYIIERDESDHVL